MLAPLLKTLLTKDDNSRTRLVFGESNLKAKAKEVNRGLDDDERRYTGPKIDVIGIDRKYNMEIVIVEVSGPPNKVNQTHYIEDRNKICKNLKAMFKEVVSSMEVPFVTHIRKLRLFGIQFYQNDVYIYSISKPCDHSFVFSQDLKFSAPNSASILSQSMPTFIKNFMGIKHLINSTEDTLDDIFAVVDETQDILEENIEDPSPHISPHKKQKRKQVINRVTEQLSEGENQDFDDDDKWTHDCISLLFL